MMQVRMTSPLGTAIAPALVEEGSVGVISSTTPDDPKQREAAEKSLWRWNLVCGCFHLFQAIVVLALGLGKSGRFAGFKLPLTTSFLEWENGYPVPDLQIRALLPFVATTSGFAFMSAAAHFTVLGCYKTYIADLRKGINRFRWYEYAASSSLMIALIAMLFGVYDIMLLVAIIGVNASMNLFGYCQEELNQYTPKTLWTPFWFGCFAGVIPWAIVLTYLAGSPSVSGIPAFVWAILGVYLVAFNTFPLNMIFQYKKVGKFSDAHWGWRQGGYYYGEKLYQVQSLVSKSLLLWLVVGGSNQPNNYNK